MNQRFIFFDLARYILRYIFCFLFFVNAYFLVAQHEEEIIIKADQVTYNDKEKKSSASGNAVVDYKKKNENYHLRAQNIVALHTEGIQNSKENNDYKQIDADKDVFFENDKYTLQADHCVFENEKKLITCTNNGILSDKIKGNKVQGKKIILNIKEDYYQVFGDGNERAEVFIFQDKN